jgi:hypothetical protein
VIIFRLVFGPRFFYLPRCTNHVLLTIPSITVTHFTPASRQSFPSPFISVTSYHLLVMSRKYPCLAWLLRWWPFVVPIMQSLRSVTTFSCAHHLSLSRTTSITSTPPPLYFVKITFNIIPPYTLRSSKWSHSLGPPHQNPPCRYPVHCICHVPSTSHSSRYDQPGYW